MAETAIDLCREVLGNWRKTMDEVLPLCFLRAFIMGCSRNEKEVAYLIANGKLEKPLEEPFFNDLLERGMALMSKMMEEVICPSCNKSLPKTDDLKFCSYCGKELEKLSS